MKLPFEKIYCLHLVESTDRLETSKNEFKKVGIYDDVNYWVTCRHPYSEEIGNFLTENGLMHCNGKGAGGAYNCIRNWYEIIKTSYLSGVESILCVEDDIRFDMPTETFSHIMNNIPEDYDIIRFGYTDKFCNFFYEEENCFIERYDIELWGTQMFALSRNGMKYYIDFVDNLYCVADYPLFMSNSIKENGLKLYFSTRNFYNMKYDCNSEIGNQNMNNLIVIRCVLNKDLFDLTRSSYNEYAYLSNYVFFGKEFLETVLFKTDFRFYYKYICFCDEDCVFGNEINNIIEMMEKTDIDMVGVPDGGETKMRVHRPDVPNSFFLIIKTDKLCNLSFDDYNSYEVKNGYEGETFNFDNFEPYYKLLCYLVYQLNFNFFKLKAKQSKFDNVTTEVYFDDKLVAAHTWFSRCYVTEEHHDRINNSIMHYLSIL